ncbi:MAG: polyprenyl synthetase family protein [Deltaproteobacteria bacterium]|nr:polyprenyl synthetase family protein [Deltaproteobacteria bacterium]MBW2660005.1 polyprenyl synthetase family protein [Deltaproteobacteria bacterium]
MQSISFEKLFAVIKREAARIENQMRQDFAELLPVIDDFLAEILEYGLFNGGKRIRPLLVIAASRLCGGSDDKVYRLASAFEYIHSATLFHDDIIDNSDIRRGNPSVHRKFGTAPAILAGDFLHAFSMSLVGRFSGQEGLNVFCSATAGMVDGEFVQLRNSANANLSEHDYHQAIMGKTGLLISSSCVIGGMYGGGNKEQIKALQIYGDNLGAAFQIIDDILDYLGDPAKTGKAVGNDLVDGKMTLPLILTLKKGAGSDREELLAILADKSKRKESVKDVCRLIEKYNGFGLARMKAEEAVIAACSALQIFSDNSTRMDRELLDGLAHYVLTRDK